MLSKPGLDQRIAALLADPAHDGHPLREALDELWRQAHEQMARIERITQISDAYQSMALQREQGLYERFDRQVRRLSRIARISDHYQSMMRDLNQTLEDTSRRDPLTGLFNRRALMDLIRRQVQRASMTGQGFVVAMLDVDHFKSVNDRYGHETGDRVLVELADRLLHSIRTTDYCGRWGGEEFLLLLPDTHLSGAQVALDHVIEGVRALSIATPGEALRLTISVGMADHQRGETLSDTLSRADRALYLAKHGGRDRVVLSATGQR